jgi:phosphohistidine phosphatase
VGGDGGHDSGAELTRLFVIRHAEAAPGDPDDMRSLTPEGREQARALGERLAREGVRLDALISSPLLRARETAAALARALSVPAETDDRLAPGATADDVLALTVSRGETVAIIGHQPDCGEIVSALTGRPEPAFPAASVQIVELAG